MLQVLDIQNPIPGLSRSIDLSQPLPEDGKPQLVGTNVRDMIEMGFWTIKFLEDFEKQYDNSGRMGDVDGVDRSDGGEEMFGRVEGEGKIWGPNVRAFLKLMRYVSKFLSTYDKFYKNNS